MSKKISYLVFLFPILFALMVLGMEIDYSGGNDLSGQIYILQNIEGDNIIELLSNSNKAILYSATYLLLNTILGVTPIVFIALIAILYFVLLILMCSKFFNINEGSHLTNNRASRLVFLSMLAFCPIFVCVSRYLFAIDLVLLGCLLFLSKHRLLGLTVAITAMFAHEGIKLIYSIPLLAFALHYFWLSKNKSITTRNIIIIVISLLLLVIGPTLFTSISSYMGNRGLISETYVESYVENLSGDKEYKFVIVLTMLGPLFVLFVNSIIDKKNDFLNCICISAVFIICLLYNQKIFYVQRIMMFMPIFIGFSSIRIMSAYVEQKKNMYIYSLILYSIPVIYLAQLYFTKSIFFGL